MKTRLLMTTCLLLGMICTATAQKTVTRKADFFEGELVYETFENHSKLILRMSSGMAYNGKSTVRVLMKGPNLHIIDEPLHMHAVLLPYANRAVIYNDLLKRGQEFSYQEYVGTYMSSFSPHDISVAGVNISHEGGIKDTGTKQPFLNEQCEVYKGELVTNKNSKAEMELLVLPTYSIYKSYWSFLYGVEAPGLVAKWSYKAVSKVPLMGEGRSFVESELKQINARPVSDEEMLVPEDIDIVISASPNKVVSLYSDTKKYLKKNGMYPSEMDKEVTFKTEDEWNF